jgi:hypothetical protein
MPSGRGTLSIHIGNIPLQIECPARLRAQAARRYAGFSQAAGASGAVRVRLRERASPPVREAEFHCTWNEARLEASRAEAAFRGVRSEFTLDSLVRMLLSFLLAEREGFLLHAAAVVRASRVLVFMGRSGAGKSTVARLASGTAAVLTDEISLLRRERGEWRAYGTPFWGEFHAGGQNASFPLTGVYLLQKARENRVEPLERSQALRAVLENVLFFSKEKAHQERLLEWAAALVEQVPMHRLHFRRDASFWEVLPT